MKKSKKRALRRSTAVTLLIWIITFYLVDNGFLPLQVYYGGATGRMVVGIASFLAARCFMGGFIRKRYHLSFTIFGITSLFFLIFGVIYLIWGLNEDAKDFVYPCLIPAILGVFTKLNWRHVLEDFLYEMEREGSLDKKSKHTNDAVIEESESDIEFIEVAPKSKPDPLLEDVTKYALEHKSCSVSTIQRNFEVGFNRACRIAEQLERAGVISANNPPAQRQILVDNIDEAMQKIEVFRRDMEVNDD